METSKVVKSRAVAITSLTSAFYCLAIWLGCAAVATSAAPNASMNACVGGPSFTEEESFEACSAIIAGGNEGGEAFLVALYNRANIYKSRHQFQLAIADLTEALQRKPDFALAYVNRADAYSKMLEYRLAIDDFGYAIRLQPNLAEAYNGRGNAYLGLGRYDLAKSDYAKAISLKPRYPIAFNNLGNADLRLSSFDDAITDYNKAIEQDPSLAEAYANRCLAFAVVGKYDLALADCDTAILKQPKLAAAYNHRGLIFAARGDFDRAISNYDAAIENDPRFAKAYANRGWAYFRRQRNMDDLDKAIADLTGAIDCDASLTGASESLAVARAAKEDLVARARAQGTGRRVALVLANSSYVHASELPNASNDADDVAHLLTSLGYEMYGYPRKNFTHEGIRAALEEFAKATSGADAAVVWYTGHGEAARDEYAQDAQEWVMPVEANVKASSDVARFGIRVDSLLNVVSTAKHLRLVVIDACRNNAFWNGTKGLQRAEVRRPDVLIVFSAQPGSIALDNYAGGVRNSPFAKAFLDSALANPKRDIRLTFADVRKRTQTLTQGQQSPQIVDGMGIGDTVTLSH